MDQSSSPPMDERSCDKGRRVEIAHGAEEPYPESWEAGGAGYGGGDSSSVPSSLKEKTKSADDDRRLAETDDNGCGRRDNVHPLAEEPGGGGRHDNRSLWETGKTVDEPLSPPALVPPSFSDDRDGDWTASERDLQEDEGSGRRSAPSIPEALAVVAADDRTGRGEEEREAQGGTCYCDLPCCGCRIPLDDKSTRRLTLVGAGLLVAAITAVAIGAAAASGAFGNREKASSSSSADTATPVAPSMTRTPSLQPSPEPLLSAVVTAPCEECTWIQIGSDLDGFQDHDLFGFYVSLAAGGTRMAVSVPFHNNAGGTDSGLVCVYDVGNDGAVSPAGQCIQGSAASDHLRGFLSRDGNRLVVNAPLHDSGTGKNAGRVRIFELARAVGGSWTQLGGAILGEAGEYPYFNFGKEDLSRDGDAVAVGAQGYAGEIGRVRVFNYVGGGWSQRGADIEGGTPGDRCEQASISGEGTTVAVGCLGPPSADGDSQSSGRVRVFRFETGSWAQLGEDITCGRDPKNNLFGVQTAISFDGRTVAASDNMWVDMGKGRVCIFALENDEHDGTETWVQVGEPIVGDASGDVLSSISLSDDGSRLAAGSFRGDGGRGYVRVYDLQRAANEFSWHQVGDKIVGQSGGEHFGISVSLSDDGARLAVGGFSPDRMNGEKVGGDGIGVARIYELRPRL